MHMQLLRNDKVVAFDRTNIGPSNISLPAGKCHHGGNKTPPDDNCTAHSVEYDVASNSIRPVLVLSDFWCSSASVSPAGTVIQTGGYGEGTRVVRRFSPCNDAECDWEEIKYGLTRPRWYSTDHILPDGRQIIVGGRRAFNYEFFPKSGPADAVYSLPFLAQTTDPGQGAENNLYPFVLLNVDGNLFIFANNRAILLDYVNNIVVRQYPEIPGGEPRNYPSSGSAVLLPLKNLKGSTTMAEVLVCGGSPKDAYYNARRNIFVGALNTCGRIVITDPNPVWITEEMPFPRVMGDMVILPTGNVLIINGATNGAAGWDLARNPAFHPVLYRPDGPPRSRFDLQNPNKIPRMYHSTAVLITDGRVLVAGSNPHATYKFTNVAFPTELSMEAFSPSYLDPKYAALRPEILSPASQSWLSYGEVVSVQFKVSGKVDLNSVKVTMVSPAFSTHSFSMNQRLLVLNIVKVKAAGEELYGIDVVAPDSGNLAPSGYYLLFVVHREIPSKGIWVHIQ
nr:aldehyde oxidase GLOX-like [Ipomoea trifida]